MAEELPIVITGKETASPAFVSVIDKLNKINGSVELAQKLMGGFTETIGAIPRRLAEWTEQSVKAGAALQAMHERTGASVEDLSALRYAAEVSETSLEGLAQGLKFLGKNVGEAMDPASQKGQAMAATFDRIGVQFKNTTGSSLPLMEVLKNLSRAMQSIPGEAERINLAMEVLGRSGTDLLPFLQQGPEKIEELMQKSKALGGVWSGEAAEAADRLEDSMIGLKTATTGLEERIGRGLQPVLSGFVNTATVAAVSTNALFDAFDVFVGATLGDAERLNKGMDGVISAIDTNMNLLGLRLRYGSKDTTEAIKADVFSLKEAIEAHLGSSVKTVEDSFKKMKDAEEDQRRAIKALRDQEADELDMIMAIGLERQRQIEIADKELQQEIRAFQVRERIRRQDEDRVRLQEEETSKIALLDEVNTRYYQNSAQYIDQATKEHEEWAAGRRADIEYMSTTGRNAEDREQQWWNDLADGIERARLRMEAWDRAHRVAIGDFREDPDALSASLAATNENFRRSLNPRGGLRSSGGAFGNIFQSGSAATGTGSDPFLIRSAPNFNNWGAFGPNMASQSRAQTMTMEVISPVIIAEREIARVINKASTRGRPTGSRRRRR